MDKLSDDYIQTVAFTTAIDLEELLIRKCHESYRLLKDNTLKDMIKEMENGCGEHIKMLKDKMIKLDIKTRQ